MASRISRPRSSTSGSTNSRRPKSRASTTSIHSASTQPTQHYRNASDSLHSFHSQPAYTQAASFTAEEMITRSEQLLTNPNQSYAIDPLLQENSNHGHALSTGYGFIGNQAGIDPQISRYNSYDGKENQALESVNEEQNQPQDNVRAECKKKKSSATTAANDNELRRLFNDNKERSLKEVAAQVLINEQGPKSEKTKQIFAMLWLDSVCKATEQSSVPRNRVFSRYATSCGTERVSPLNPASFGKLVRVIFPRISTRRLGMRGESKYHYVNLSLRDDQQDSLDQNRAQSIMDIGAGSERPSIRRQRSHMPADMAVFPSADIQLTTTFSNPDSNKTAASGCLYLDPGARNIHQGPSRSNMVRRELKFSSGNEHSCREDEPLDLPSIHDYLPIGTDIDAANALTALYRSHCISVIDCFRFCKEKMLWHHFTSFHGTLTVPVQKLLSHPKIAPWIKECNWFMYQKMIGFVAPLALQVVPVRVIDTFRAISNKLGSHISLTFQNHPQHVRDAKLGPAIIFAGLLDRLLRVNATAHAAANMLTNDANRDQMWHDWVLYVKPIRVVESSLPGCGYTRVIQILTTEIHDLLGPLSTTMHLGMNSVFANADLRTKTNTTQHAHPELDDSSTEGVLDRWTSFLQGLPSRFPEADARLLLHCIGEVGSAALRDITMAQALSFGSWWVTKVWVDEMLQWLAEKGGFMEHSPRSMEMRGEVRISPEMDFTLDETSDTLGPSRPRTAVSESVEASSHFSSVDVRRSGFYSQSRSARTVMQQNLNPYSPQDGYSNGQNSHELHANQQINQTEPQPVVDLHDEQNHRLGISQPQLQHEEPRQASTAHMIADGADDSGIGMGLDDDDLSMAKYGRFVTGDINGGSDPTDVVVC